MDGDEQPRGVTFLPASDVEQRTTEIEDLLATISGTINAAHARLVTVVATVLREGLWNQAGIVSPSHWLRWKAGVSVAQSEAIVRLAQGLDELPVTRSAFERGELSLDQVRVIAQHVPPAYDGAAAELAAQLMVPQLASALRRYPWEATEEAAEPEADALAAERPAESPSRALRTYLSFGHRDDGSWAINGRLTSEDGAVVEQALHAVRETIYQERRAEQRDDEDRVEVDGIDCLLRLTDLAASNPGQPRAARDRYRTLLHLDAETLEEWHRGQRPELHLGPWLGQPIVEHLTCDTDAQVVLERRGLAVAFGPQHPNIPARIRLLVENRDRGCRFPGCGRRRGVEIHHLTHRADGGWTVETNLVCLCRRHHTAHHRGDVAISGDPTRPDGLEFRDKHGALIAAPSPAAPRGDPPLGAWKHPPGYRLERRWLELTPAAIPSKVAS